MSMSIGDMQSAHDMKQALTKYFDTDKCIGDETFWWYIAVFMRAYCDGGVRRNYFGGVDFALPDELQGHNYYVTRRDDISVFEACAWTDVIAYFESHQDSLKDLPCIGYAARS